LDRKVIRIGTRGSKLALWQAEKVRSLLQEQGIECAIVTVDTYGDLQTKDALHRLGRIGIFTKQLDLALLDNMVDIAVHSAKDMPSEEDNDLHIAAFLKREDPRDVMLGMSEEISLENFAKPLTIGTSSLRRAALIKRYFPHVTVKNIRGNLDTRLEKLKKGEYDGILLAYAGVKRMNFSKYIRHKFKTVVFPPAIGQGAIAVSCRKNDPRRTQIHQILNHQTTALSVQAERAFLRTLRGGCQTPVFGLATIIGTEIELKAGVISEDGSELFEKTGRSTQENAIQLGQKIGEEIRQEIQGNQAFARFGV